MNHDTQKSSLGLEETLKSLIWQGNLGTQEDLVEALHKAGYEVSQSKVSRLLRKLMVVKVKNEKGETVYALPKEPIPPSTHSPLAHLILKIDANESTVVIYTSPGSAPLIARLLDYHEKESTILATLAGDDTIFVAPKSIKQIKKTLSEVKDLLANISTK